MRAWGSFLAPLKRSNWSVQSACCSSVLRPPEKRVLGGEARTAESGRRGSVAEFLRERIRGTGPVTVAEYMQVCLTAPGGYYASRKAQRILGDRGDFITSPELGQIFGEMLGIWLTNELYNLGLAPRQSWQLVELGPGSGLLAADILRVLKLLRYADAVSLHLVELSPSLAHKQFLTLCDQDTARLEKAQ